MDEATKNYLISELARIVPSKHVSVKFIDDISGETKWLSVSTDTFTKIKDIILRGTR